MITRQRPTRRADVVIVGGGMAGLSAAVYLARAKRATLVVDGRQSMARWEPEVQNYLGFPRSVAGAELLRRGRMQARRYGARFVHDQVLSARRENGHFKLRGRTEYYTCRRLLLATGIFHVPPDIPGVKPCLGHSMFFCKDCDGFRVQHQAVAIYGWTNEAVRYALGILQYTHCLVLVTDGRKPAWDRRHQRWLQEYKIPVYRQAITDVCVTGRRLKGLLLEDGTQITVQALFTTRGDVYFNELARQLGAHVNPEGEVTVDLAMRTSVPGLYAAGCVTPANCQMIIAAGQGATAAQALNRELFEESLRSHLLRRFRSRQLRTRRVHPPTRQVRP